MITIQEISTRCPVIPVLALDKLEQAVPLAQALCAGGLNVLEITLRTAVGLDAIRAIARAVPEAVVGVGTVLFAEQLVQAQDAGAVFAVSPGFTPELGKAAACFGMPYLPGVFTPSDIMSAVYYGYEVLKLYPAHLAGGAGLLKTLAGPFPGLKFCPSGGVTRDSATALLALENVACVCGSWMVPSERLEAEDWEGIERLAREASALAKRTDHFLP